jgi:hypothetical protein
VGAAHVRIALPQANARLFRAQRHDVESPARGKLLSEGVRLGKKVGGVDEEHRNVGRNPSDEIEQHHAIDLKAGCHTRRLTVRQILRDEFDGILHGVLPRKESSTDHQPIGAHQTKAYAS